MNTILEYLKAEIQNVKPIDTQKALNEIFYTNNYEFLQEQILDAEEIDFDDDEYKILFKNGKNFNKNLYTDLSDNSPLTWLGIYDDKKLAGLQLINIDNDYIELIVIAKNTNYKVKFSVFEAVIKYCQEIYKRKIITFPLNDDLTDFYKKFGFVDDKSKKGYIKLDYNK